MLLLHVIAPAAFGGLERVVHTLAQGQAAAGSDVHIAVILDPTCAHHPLLDSLAAAGVRTHLISVPGRAYQRERAALKQLCRQLHPDVVHTHGYRPDVVDAGAAQSLAIPMVTTVHGFTGGDWKNRLYERLQRRAFRRFDAVVAVSRPLALQLVRQGVPADRVHIVQNAWSEPAPPLDRAAARGILGVSGAGFRIGWVGRLSHEKGADVLFDALLHLTDLPVSVSIVGSGAEERALRVRARRLGLEHRIEFHGAVRDAARLFRAFDCFVLSSRTEGTPIVLFESMASGVPIVATRIGGVPDVVSSAEALLVPPKDPGALAAAIRAIYDEPAPAAERTRRARERLLSDFTVPSWVGRYDAVYKLAGAGAADPAAATV